MKLYRLLEKGYSWKYITMVVKLGQPQKRKYYVVFHPWVLFLVDT